ncbi:pyrroline-5-carboxylate reductase [Candidatus Omnitrophota bacterium]
MKQKPKHTIGVIGCGNMGGALVKGLKAKYKGIVIRAYDKDKARLRRLKKAYRVGIAFGLDDIIRTSRTLVIAVKPQDCPAVLAAIKRDYAKQLIISVAAGIPTSFIAQHIGAKARVVRVMPNLAATISMSVSAIAKGSFATRADLKVAVKIFDSVGICLLVSEKYIDAACAVSGSGPGYVYYFMDALLSGARRLGFGPKVARQMVVQTVLGAAALARITGEDFKSLAKRVASKGGTTEAAFKVFDQCKLGRIIDKAHKAAHARARALGK